MRNLCYLHRTAGRERDKDRELLGGQQHVVWEGSSSVRRHWTVVGSSGNRSGFVGS